MLKAAAYCLSILGLAFLAVAAWLQAPEASVVRLSIAVGTVCSLMGLAVRLYHHCCDGHARPKTTSPTRWMQSAGD